MNAADSDRQLQALIVAMQCQRKFKERQRPGPQGLQGLQGLQAALLQHAARTVPHFAYVHEGAAHALAAFEPVRRQDIASNRKRFLSRQFAPRDWVDERTTSGTSGSPLSVVRDGASFYSFIYHTYARVFERIPELAGCARAGADAVLIVNDNPQRDEQIFINPSLDYARIRRIILGRGPEQDQAALAAAVQAACPLLYGRPRSLVRLAELHHQLRDAAAPPGPGRLAPRAILCSGDNLYRNDRMLLEQVFGAPVYNAYGSQEGGLIAMECPRHDHMHVLGDAARVEVLVDGCDEPQAEGYGELVVTSLENWALPFIRYRSGDVGTLVTGACSCGYAGTSIAALDGRDSVYFSVDGKRFNPSVLNPVFEGLPIRQFQVVQDRSGALRVSWIAGAQADPAATEAALRQALHSAVGALPVRIEQVDIIGAPGQKAQRYMLLQAHSTEHATPSSLAASSSKGRMPA